MQSSCGTLDISLAAWEYILRCDYGGRMKNFANVILDHGLSP